MSIMRSNIARQLYNTGGITNLINTYQNNPTLQSKMTQQEYLDLFGSQPTSKTEQIIQSSVAPTIESPIVKRPILPIIPEGSDDGGITSINRISERNQPNFMGGKQPGIIAALQRTYGDLKAAGKDIYNLLSPIQIAKRTKDAIDDMRAKRAAEIIEQIRLEEEKRLSAQLRQPGDSNRGGDGPQNNPQGGLGRQDYSRAATADFASLADEMGIDYR